MSQSTLISLLSQSISLFQQYQPTCVRSLAIKEPEKEVTNIHFFLLTLKTYQTCLPCWMSFLAVFWDQVRWVMWVGQYCYFNKNNSPKIGMWKGSLSWYKIHLSTLLIFLTNAFVNIPRLEHRILGWQFWGKRFITHNSINMKKSYRHGLSFHSDVYAFFSLRNWFHHCRLWQDPSIIKSHYSFKSCWQTWTNLSSSVSLSLFFIHCCHLLVFFWHSFKTTLTVSLVMFNTSSKQSISNLYFRCIFHIQSVTEVVKQLDLSLSRSTNWALLACTH